MLFSVILAVKQAASGAIMFNRFLFGVAVTLIGFGAASAGLLERTVALRSTQTPEEISLEKLLARGPSGNPNIILTDFALCKNFVYELGQQPRVWIPVVPGNINDPPPQPTRVHALLFSTNVQNQKELQQRCAQPKLPVLVANKLTVLLDERGLLETSYPETNFDRCLFLEEGREPSSQTKWMLMIGGGAAAVLAGLLMILAGVIRLVKRA
jgi:hypothetical protein